MGTPFIPLLEPTQLDGYDRSKPHDQQPSHIPKLFCDAMEVREAVFVREQGVPLEFEHDADDARACHWVLYASINQTQEPEVRDPDTGDIIQARKSVTRSQPIGTLRVVPFPHPPHPKDGGRYVGDVLQEDGGAAAESKLPPLTEVEEARLKAALPYGPDRATTLHDGKEPYVKLGRLAVLKEYRGRGIAGQLWNAARMWLEDKSDFFDPSVAQLGLDNLKVDTVSEIPRWRGLVCCHAQEQATKTYERWGFRVDQGMGRWSEEGMPHVGMFLRLNVKEKPRTA